MRISDWSSDVCSSDLFVGPLLSSIIPMLILVGAVAILFAALSGALGLSGSPAPVAKPLMTRREEAMLVVLEELFPMYRFHAQVAMEIGRASCRERVRQYV